MESNRTNPEFEILHEDDKCLVVVKPGGVLTQAPPGIDSLELRVKTFLKRRDRREGRIYLGVPHRLDRPVAGVMVLGKNRKAARRLSEQFQGRLVKKTYWAAVSGAVDPPSGTWTDFVRKIPGEARSEVVRQRHPEGRLAILHYRALASSSNVTLLEIELETGRTHQIRVQAGSRGYAICGDDLYGSDVPFGPSTTDPRQRRVALLGRRLAFRHPKTYQPMRFEAPLPPEWLQLDLPCFARLVRQDTRG
jgi:RluA family pseudouridine synthase